MTLEAWTRRLNRGTMDVMRVDNSEQGKPDHGFGLGAHEPERHGVSLGSEQLGDEAGTEHGLLDSLGHGAVEQLGGHVEIGHLAHDFGHDGLHNGLDGLHDSVQASLGLGFGGDDHHSLHEGLHDSQDVGHDTQPDVAHDATHDHDLGDLF